MIDRLRLALTLLSALGCGLMAGLFFAFSVAVMGALAHIAPAAAIAAMQSINRVILNPVFLSVFMGTAAACGLLAVSALSRWNDPAAVSLLAGGLLYVVGGFLVTIVFNVPMNNALAVVDPASTEGASYWTRYLTHWTAWNHLRTVACLAAAAALTIALYLQARSPGTV